MNAVLTNPHGDTLMLFYQVQKIVESKQLKIS